MKPQPRTAIQTHEHILDGSILGDQIETELDAVNRGVIRYREAAAKAVKRLEGAALKPADRLLLHWFGPVARAIKLAQRATAKGKPDTARGVYGPVILSLDAERLAVIVLHEVVSRCMDKPRGVTVSQLTYAIGRTVIAEIHMDLLKKDETVSARDISRVIQRRSPMRINWWAKKTLEDPIWSKQACVHTGAFLLWTLIGHASANGYDDKFKLAFHHVDVFSRQKTIKVIRMDHDVMRMIEKGHSARQLLRPHYLPMIAKPCPWPEGGYIKIRTPFISKPTPSQKAALKEADLAEIYECLNAVQSTPWQVNEDGLFDVEYFWARGGGLLRIPRADDVEEPPKPRDIDTNADAKKRWKRSAADVWDQNIALKSARKEFLEKIGVARDFADKGQFFFPHQLDFRGRAYPIPANLNHQGDDVSRGLLRFAEPKPAVSDDARRWLKIHAANCYGIGGSFDERIAWVDVNLGNIARSAADPIDSDFWMDADDGKSPWQFLAASRALMNPNKAAKLPIQQDGTCNGLQHYAALARSSSAAAMVNMLPCDRPSDVYTSVADVVAQLVYRDTIDDGGRTFSYRQGMEQNVIRVGELALMIHKAIARNVVKPTVMTSVYGVTMIGARAQVYEKLKKIGISQDFLYIASAYLSKIVLAAIGQVCEDAGKIMGWLRSLAKIVASEPIDELVSWTAPLGLPVVQPYRKWFTMDIRTALQRIRIQVDDESVPPAVGRHCDGMAPNYIHSLDATHMFMTARACHKEGIAFAAVHDSYWTHAATATRLAQIIREQFVELHKEPLLEILVKSFRDRYPDTEFPDPPPRGDLDLNQVKNAPYFFS